MEELLKHLGNICMIDRVTLAVLAGLCIGSALALREYFVYPILAFLSLPILFSISVIIQYLFITQELYIPRRLDQWLLWTVLASMCGNMIGLAIVACIGRLKDRAAPFHNRVRAAASAKAHTERLP